MARRSKKPWWKAAHKAWYTSHHGNRVFLAHGKSKNDRASYDRACEVIAKKCPADVDWRLGDMNTVADLAARFIELHVSTMKGYRVPRNFVTKFAAKYGKVKVRDILPLHLTEFIKSHVWADSTILNAMNWIGTMFNWGIKQGLITCNPVKGMKKPKTQSRGAAYVIADEEHDALMAVAGAESRRMLTFLYGTGCRPSELRKARREHYHPVLRAIVFRDEVKTEGRVVNLPEGCVRIVEELLDRGRDFIFPNSGRNRRGKKVKRPFAEAALEKWFARLKKKAGITREECIMYSYRHKFATDLIVAGTPTLTVAKLMGHTSTKQVKKTYAHLLNGNLTAALDRVR